MKNIPHSSLLVLLLGPLLFLILLVNLMDSPTLWAQDTPWPQVGKIRPAQANQPGLHAPSSPSPHGSAHPLPLRSISPQQAFSLTLKATVGLNPHECAEQPIINVTANIPVVVCYFITNSGSENIELHSVDDNHLGRIVTEQPFPLGPGVSALITTTRKLTETTVHMGTWYGLDAEGAVLAFASDFAKSYVDGLVVETGVQQPDGECWYTGEFSVPPGTEVDFCYRLNNQTDLTFSQHSLTEGELGEIASSLDYELGPGESVTLQELGVSISDLVTTTSNYSLAWRTTTTTAPAELPEDSFDSPISLSAIGTLTGRVPGITGRLTVGLERNKCAATKELTVFAGTEIVFCYGVTNVGGVTFTHHTIADNFTPAGEISVSSNQALRQATQRIVREREPFQMSPNVLGEFTEAQLIDQSAVVTMTWVAYSANPVTGTAVQTPDTLKFPAPFVSATATSQVSITVLPLASISLTIYEDSNQNGEQDEGELSIPSASVQLTNTNGLSQSIVTDSGGIANFADLPPAVYEISVDFAKTPYLYELADGNISSLLLRSGENEGVALGFIRTGRRPQKVYIPVQVQ